MDLDGIEVFVKVVEAGSFSQAAKLLGMPNSTVSAKLSALEKRLGVTLLQRSTRKLRATPAGETYFQQCVQALEQLQAAESELTSEQREPQGLLRVTAPADIGHTLLATLVRGFLQQYPKTEVELVVTNRVLDLIAELNPHVASLDTIESGQPLWLPDLTLDSLIRKQADGSLSDSPWVTSDCGRVLLI